MGPGMGMGMQMQPKQTMQLILAPRMIQSMEILQLPIMALQERIQQELQENPVLEQKEVATDESSASDETTDGQVVEEEQADFEKELVIDESNDKELDFD